jgi:peptidyl-dipeptidase Dcp
MSAMMASTHHSHHPSEQNQLLSNWDATTEFGLPPFSQIRVEDFEPAFCVAMNSHLDDLKAIVDNDATPTFVNTVEAFDRAGSIFSKVSYTFDNLCSSNGVPELQLVEAKMAGPIAAHSNKVFTFPGLFAKIDSVNTDRQSQSLNAEQLRLVERIHLDFVRAGAKFDAAMQKRYAVITEEMANLETKFTQNLMADESEITMPLGEDERGGLPEDLLEAAQTAASERASPNTASGSAVSAATHVITLSRSLVVPFLTFSTRRDLREKAWKLWTSRGELHKDRDNLSLAVKILQLRLEQAQLHGYATYSDYALADTMAGAPQKVMELLEV